MWSFFFTDIGLLICFLGVLGIFSNRRNILISVISIELMLYGLNFDLVALSIYLDDILGQVFSFFLLTLAASESAIALALITAFFKNFFSITKVWQ